MQAFEFTVSSFDCMRSMVDSTSNSDLINLSKKNLENHFHTTNILYGIFFIMTCRFNDSRTINRDSDWHRYHDEVVKAKKRNTQKCRGKIKKEPANNISSSNRCHSYNVNFDQQTSIWWIHTSVRFFSNVDGWRFIFLDKKKTKANWISVQNKRRNKRRERRRRKSRTPPPCQPHNLVALECKLISRLGHSGRSGRKYSHWLSQSHNFGK